MDSHSGDNKGLVAIVAGNGDLPIEFANCAKEKGHRVLGIALANEADPELSSHVDHFEQIKIGKFGALLKLLREYQAKEVAFIGGVKKIKIFRDLGFDLPALNLLAKTRSMQDDVLLRAVADEIEAAGVTVISSARHLNESVPAAGCITTRKFSEQESEDAKFGLEMARGVGALDIGQSVVVYKQVVVAVEAVDGTDATILRAGEVADTAGQAKAGKGAVLVKIAKPQQDLRFDLPTIGAETIKNCHKAGVTGIILETGKSLIVDREKTIALANKHSIAILITE